MKAKEIMEHFQEVGTWVDWDNTNDQFLHGDPDAEVKGIATAWSPTNSALKQTSDKGLNVFISHQPAFYHLMLARAKSAIDNYHGSPSTDQLARAKRQLLDDLEQRLQGAEGYGALDAAQKQQLSAPFAQAKQQFKGQKLIAVIRDQRNRFEDEQYPQLLLKLDQFASPKPAPAEQPSPSTQPENETLGVDTPEQPMLKVAEPRIVQSRHIKVGYPKPWLTSETELDDYLQKQREAWLKEIQAGNRVQI